MCNIRARGLRRGLKRDYCDSSEMYPGWGVTKHCERFFTVCSTDTDARVHCYVDARALKVCLEHRQR